MASWDELTEEQKARYAAYNRRHHAGVNAEIRMVRQEERAGVLGGAIDWLRARGFAEAADALEAECFEVAG